MSAQNPDQIADSFSDMSVSSVENSDVSTQMENKNDVSLEGSEFDTINVILKSCKPDLSRYLDRFKAAYIINESVEFLTPSNVAEIFKTEIGLREIFLQGLNNFRNTDEHKEDRIKERKKPKEYKEFNKWKPIVSIIQLKAPLLLKTEY